MSTHQVFYRGCIMDHKGRWAPQWSIETGEDVLAMLTSGYGYATSVDAHIAGAKVVKHCEEHNGVFPNVCDAVLDLDPMSDEELQRRWEMLTSKLSWMITTADRAEIAALEFEVNDRYYAVPANERLAAWAA